MSVTGEVVSMVYGSARVIGGVGVPRPDDELVPQIGRVVVAVAQYPTCWDVNDRSIPEANNVFHKIPFYATAITGSHSNFVLTLPSFLMIAARHQIF